MNDQAVLVHGSYTMISIESHHDHETYFPQFSDITVINQDFTDANLTMQKLLVTVLVLQVTNIVYGALPSFGRCPNVRG